MCENLCGNCVGKIELTVHSRIILKTVKSTCNGTKKLKCTPMKCHTNVNSILPTQLPHKFSYIVAIFIHNQFDHQIFYHFLISASKLLSLLLFLLFINPCFKFLLLNNVCTFSLRFTLFDNTYFPTDFIYTFINTYDYRLLFDYLKYN
jgi:hypothetical protein